MLKLVMSVRLERRVESMTSSSVWPELEEQRKIYISFGVPQEAFSSTSESCADSNRSRSDALTTHDDVSPIVYKVLC
jgi:hypothetical protein